LKGVETASARDVTALFMHHLLLLHVMPFLSSLRITEMTFIVVIALIKTNSSLFSLAPTTGVHLLLYIRSAELVR
jgi:putative NIF3 family GTP cyclohydrolase 1 type 2